MTVYLSEQLYKKDATGYSVLYYTLLIVVAYSLRGKSVPQNINP